MKYLKEFEGLNNKRFWILPTDERIDIATTKIGANDTYYDDVIKNFRRLEQKYIIFFNNPLNISQPKWNYIGLNDGSVKYLEGEGYKNMGYVEVPEYELDQKKYNL